MVMYFIFLKKEKEYKKQGINKKDRENKKKREIKKVKRDIDPLKCHF